MLSQKNDPHLSLVQIAVNVLTLHNFLPLFISNGLTNGLLMWSIAQIQNLGDNITCTAHKAM